MRSTKLLQEIRKMRYEEAYTGWQAGRLTQEEAARLLGLSERTAKRTWAYARAWLFRELARAL